MLILAVISAEINGQAYYNDGLQQYYGEGQNIKPVQEETEDSPELSRYYRAEPDTAQASLQFQPAQYNYQSPGYQQQQLQPLAYYQQQQLQPQVLYQQQAQPQLQQQQAQLRSLQGFADPRFQQDYKHRLTYAAQENPTPPPNPAPITPHQQQAASPFQFQPPQAQQPFAQLQQQYAPQAQQFVAQPQQFAPQNQQFVSQPQQQLFTPSPQQFNPSPQYFTPSPQQYSEPQQIAPQPQTFAAQPQPIATQQEQLAQSPKLGVSYSSAGIVSRTVFNGLGASYSF